VHHGSSTDVEHDLELSETDLLSPLTIRAVTLRNRMVMSPMCQYSASEGLANDWHLVHLGSRAVGGISLVMAEATAVTSEGRISPADLGIWSEKHVEPLARITRFVHSQGAASGIQLAHAGRKGSCAPPWEGGGYLAPAQGGWAVVGPSALPFNAGDPLPIALDEREIERIIGAFESAATRAVAAGFDVIEIHAAHGYLLHQFLSPLTNRRQDHYGGSRANRMRLPLEVIRRVRGAMAHSMPLFVRISATDWVDGGWDVAQSIEFARSAKDLGVDLIDASSGGLVPKAQIPVSKGFQVPFARTIREQARILTGAVGLISEVSHADEIITRGIADVVLLGRELLRNPCWPVKAQYELEQEPVWPIQYGYALKRRAK
jgi:2,4-dienoyl-CoA reductase-like NADH-dependent reductase (Old Yellow Enzyme family)